MKTGQALIVAGVIIMMIGVAWLITGWPATDRGAAGPGPSAVPASTPEVPVSTLPATPVTPATMPVTTTQPYPSATPSVQATLKPSSDDIRMHFLDLAFGAGNAYLERWNATEGDSRVIISVSANNDADIPLLENAVRQFNSISKSTRVSERIKEGDNGDIAIKFIPENGIDGVVVNTSGFFTSRELQVDGITAARIGRGTVYINANLKGDVRNHILVRSLFSELGLAGESDTYPDSLFYSGENTNTNLSYADLKAVEIMYGNGMTPGMNLAGVKETIFLR